MKVAVTGAAGHLGAAILQTFRPFHEVVALTRHDLDITDRAAVRRVMDAVQPDVIVNCAAFNDVDSAERDPGPALDINAFGVLALARAAASLDAVLVHFSTDFVFDGEITRPYVEDDPPRPLSFYGCTKLLGERLAADAPAHYVLRVESLFGGPTAGTTARAGAFGTLVDRLRRGEPAPVFTDRTVSPSYAPDVAAAAMRIVERAIPPGLYHCVNSGAATWDHIAIAAAEVLGVEPVLTPITLADIALPAGRPRFCALSNARLRSFGIEMPSWRDAVTRWLTEA